MTMGTDVLTFTYDAAGIPMSLSYNGTDYYYATNLQGDVVGILDSAGQQVVAYSYDAWGKLLSTTGTMATTLGTHNPLRYRGYVYDSEYGYYYLQSRYYDPQIGRFLNADGYAATGQGILGNNMFAYCGNNPSCLIDTEGTRYCAATTVGGESQADRETSCESQRTTVINRPKKLYRISSGKIILIYAKGAKPANNIENNTRFVVVYDMRHNTDNPNMQVRNSYRIFEKDKQYEIIDKLLEYDCTYPSEQLWGRTAQSMSLEWDAHNLFAAFDDSARHTDFDKEEEGKGLDYFIDKAVKRGLAKMSLS